MQYDESSGIVTGHSDWYNRIADQINQLKDILPERDYKKLKLDMLLCVAERTDEFSDRCGQCQIFQQDISSLVPDIAYLVQTGDKERRKAHVKKIDSVVSHLRKQHKLVTEGYYMGIAMAIGAGIGVALGAATDIIGGGVPLGIGAATVIGMALDARAKRENRVLCPKKSESKATGVNRKLVKIGIFVLLLLGIIGFAFFALSR
jgi:hypothetical protein